MKMSAFSTSNYTINGITVEVETFWANPGSQILDSLLTGVCHYNSILRRGGGYQMDSASQADPQTALLRDKCPGPMKTTISAVIQVRENRLISWFIPGGMTDISRDSRAKIGGKSGYVIKCQHMKMKLPHKVQSYSCYTGRKHRSQRIQYSFLMGFNLCV